MHRIAFVALVVVAAACGSSADRPGRASSTAPTTSTSTSCTAAGSVEDRVGAAVADPGRPTALLSNVQVQTSGCVDEIAFSFIGARRPAWSVGYVDGPFSADPSGRPLEVAGTAFLRVRLEPASGVDLSGSEAREIYDGPTAMRPGQPSDVQAVVRLGDFEAVTTWVIGLPGKRPFDVVTRDEQLVVRVSAPRPRVTRCVLAGSPLTLGYPAGWFAELSDRWACQYFDPQPFVVHPSTNDFRWSVTAQVTDAPAATVLSRWGEDDSTVIRTSTTVAGFAATRLDVTASGNGMLPAGWRFRMYVVDAGPRAVTLTGAPSGDATTIARNAAAIDAMVALVERA
jgi:hypothetical protein